MTKCNRCGALLPDVGTDHRCPDSSASSSRGRLHALADRPQQHEHRNVEPHSVELTLTAAGKISGSVKIYDADEARAFERAAKIMDDIRRRFPAAPGKE